MLSNIKLYVFLIGIAVAALFPCFTYAESYSIGTSIGVGETQGLFPKSSSMYDRVQDGTLRMKWSRSNSIGIWFEKQLAANWFSLLNGDINRDIVDIEQEQYFTTHDKTAYNSVALTASGGYKHALTSKIQVSALVGAAIEKGWDDYNTLPYYGTEIDTLIATKPIQRIVNFDYSFLGILARVQVGIDYQSIGLRVGYSRELTRFNEENDLNMPRVHKFEVCLISTVFGGAK